MSLAKLFLHPRLTRAQAQQVCRDHNLTPTDDGRGAMSVAHQQKIAEARERFGQPFAHEPDATWKPRTVSVLQEWMANRVKRSTDGADGPEAA